MAIHFRGRVQSSKEAVEFKEGKRERITNAAIRVFAEKGFYQAKISEIARHASVADGTIYLYFGNKDELLFHVFEVTLETFLERARSAVEQSGDPSEQLELFINEHLKMVETLPDHAAVMTVELRQSPKFMREYQAAGFGAYLKLLAEIIERGQAKGLFRRDLVPWLTARALFGMLDEMALMWVLGRNFDLKQTGRVVHDVFLNGTLQKKE